MSSGAITASQLHEIETELERAIEAAEQAAGMAPAGAPTQWAQLAQARAAGALEKLRRAFYGA